MDISGVEEERRFMHGEPQQKKACNKNMSNDEGISPKKVAPKEIQEKMKNGTMGSSGLLSDDGLIVAKVKRWRGVEVGPWWGREEPNI